MQFRLRRPRELARQLRAAARLRPEEVVGYLEENTEAWAAIADATPGDAADILEAVSDEAAGDLLADLDDEQAADVLEELRDDFAAELLLELPVETAAAVIAEMPEEEAVDILAEIPAERLEPILAHCPPNVRAEIRRLLAYAPDSAGGLMTTDIAVLPIGMTAGEAIERLRVLHEELEDLSYVYIADDARTLVGVLSFRDLVFKRPGVGLDEAMVRNPVSVTVDTDQEVVAELTQRYNLFGVPVVDAEGRLLGMVTHESVIEAVQQEATEDFATAMGAGAEETVYTPVGSSVRMRLPWLFVNLVLSLMVAWVVESQTGLISRHPILAAMMPVVASLGGNGGSQSLAVVIRSMATDDVPSSRVGEIVRRQAGIGSLEGIGLALVTGSFAYMLVEFGIFEATTDPTRLAGVLAIAALANLAVATTAGTMIPLILRGAGLDPALASNILLTLITDVVGFGGFLVVAALLL